MDVESVEDLGWTFFQLLCFDFPRELCQNASRGTIAKKGRLWVQTIAIRYFQSPQKGGSKLDVVVKHELALFRTGRKSYLLAFELYIGVYKFIAKVWFEITLITF